MTEKADIHGTEADGLHFLNRALIRAVKALGDGGQGELACRIAAAAWAALREERPKEAEKLNGALHYLTRHESQQPEETDMSASRHLDVRDLPPPRRHALIFDSCGKLSVGDAVILVNDHDPKPLYYQFEAERSGEFGWEYVEAGPTVWRVCITRKVAAW